MPVTYYYYSYLLSRDNLGNGVIGFDGDFDITVVHRFLLRTYKMTCVVISWQSISQNQFQDFMQYAADVNGIVEPAGGVKNNGAVVLKLFPGGKDNGPPSA